MTAAVKGSDAASAEKEKDRRENTCLAVKTEWTLDGANMTACWDVRGIKDT